MSQKKILIFTHSSYGHNLEYLNHLYLGFNEEPNNEYIFIVPDHFEMQSKLFDWPISKNIKFDLVKSTKLGNTTTPWYIKSLRFSIIIKKYITKYNASSVFLMDLMVLLPFLPLFINSKIRISGIIYGIYLYRWKELKICRKISEIIWHLIISKCPVFNHLYILNDNTATNYLNKLYNTNKFKYLPDPYVKVPALPINMKANYSIQKHKKVLLHFGSFGERKGTLFILDSILRMDQREREKYVFVFAGVIQHGIKEKFYNLVEEINNKTDILIFPQFNSFEFISNWCYTCDAILAPYLKSYQSSGVIGYASQYKKPVIAPGFGVIGKLVKKFHLGITMKTITTSNFLAALKNIDNWQSNDNNYLKNNTVSHFLKIIRKYDI